MYDFTNLTSTRDIAGFLVEVNHWTNDFFSIGLLIVLFIITVAMLRDDIIQGVVAGAFITGIAGLFFVLMGLLSQDSLPIMIIIIAASGVAAFVNSRRD